MFVVRNHNESIKWPVKVEMPVDGGKTQKVGFTAHFIYLNQDRLDELATLPDGDFIKEIMVGWDGVQDEDKNEVPFSPEAAAELVKIGYVKRAIVTAYWDFIAGRATKN